MAEETNEQMLATPGDFGQFTLEKELGHGGMGGVYLARDKMLDRQVAIKVMLKSLGDDATFVARFQREAQAAARLNHPNIAQIYSFGQEQGMPYIAMELVSGGSLDKQMEENPGTLNYVKVMKIGQQMADALALAAEQGLVHGDVKPENVLFDGEGNAKLVDFGLAAMQGDSNEIWGTPYYISPEKVRRQPIDYRADIYSLGATLYHVLTGVPPFDGEDATAVVKARFEGAPKKPSEIRGDLPPEVDALIMRMLEVEPAMRYPTYQSLLGDFKRFLAKAGPVRTQRTAGPKIKIKGRGGNKPAGMTGRQTTVTMTGITGITELPADLVAEATAEEPKKKKLSIGAMVGLVAGGIVLTILLVVGGLFWYIHHTEEQERLAELKQITGQQEKANAAIAGTMKAIETFDKDFEELVEKANKEIGEATKEMRGLIPEELRVDAEPLLAPSPTKDVADAVEYTNKVITAAVMAAEAEANKEAAEKKAAEEAAAAATNATETAGAATNAVAGATNAVAAAEGGTNAVAAATNAVAAATNAAPAAATNAAPAAAEEKKEESAAAEKADEDPAEGEAAEGGAKKMAMPLAVKQFAELWADVYYCRGAAIRVKGDLIALAMVHEKAKKLTATDLDTVKKLAAISQELVEKFDAVRGSKMVEQTQRKVGVVKNRAKQLVRAAQGQIVKAKAAAEKLAKEKAEKEAKEAAEKKAAEEHKAKVEQETAFARERFEARAVPLLRHLSWDLAIKQLKTAGEELTTREGKEEMRLLTKKVQCMQGLQRHFAKHAKGFTFRNKDEVTAADAKSITIAKMKRLKNGKTAIDRRTGEPTLDRNHKIDWERFYGKAENIGYMSQLINGLVYKGRDKTRIGPLEWSNHMLGAALTLQYLYSEAEGAADFIPSLVKRAVKEFDSCRKYAEAWFPDVKLDEEEAAE